MFEKTEKDKKPAFIGKENFKQKKRPPLNVKVNRKNSGEAQLFEKFAVTCTTFDTTS